MFRWNIAHTVDKNMIVLNENNAVEIKTLELVNQSNIDDEEILKIVRVNGTNTKVER